MRVAVAGCGPGGLAAALYLKRAGHDVTVFDRFAEPTAVGSGLVLQPTGQAVLAELGLSADIAARGAPLTRLFGRAAPSGRAVLDVRYKAGALGLAVHRTALFDVLFAAAQGDGVRFAFGQDLCGSKGDHHQRYLLRRDGATLGPFALVIDAAGARSPLIQETGAPLAYGALWATLDWLPGGPFDPSALEQRYRAAKTMIGVLPIGGVRPHAPAKATLFWSLKAAALDAWRAAGLDAWKREARALWPETEGLLDQIHDPAQLTFARYSHRTTRRPVEPALAHLGDSWRTTSPQLGQGANMALLDAAALNAALADAPDLPRALSRYAALRRGHTHVYQALSAAFTPFYQSDSRLLPWLRDYLVGPLSRVPPGPAVLRAIVCGTAAPPLQGLTIGRPAQKL